MMWAPEGQAPVLRVVDEETEYRCREIDRHFTRRVRERICSPVVLRAVSGFIRKKARSSSEDTTPSPFLSAARDDKAASSDCVKKPFSTVSLSYENSPPRDEEKTIAPERRLKSTEIKRSLF